jgi:hypothetical protein
VAGRRKLQHRIPTLPRRPPRNAENDDFTGRPCPNRRSRPQPLGGDQEAAEVGDRWTDCRAVTAGMALCSSRRMAADRCDLRYRGLSATAALAFISISALDVSGSIQGTGQIRRHTAQRYCPHTGRKTCVWNCLHHQRKTCSTICYSSSSQFLTIFILRIICGNVSGTVVSW